MQIPFITRTAKSATAKRSLTLLGVLAVFALIAGYAVAAPRGPVVEAPTITSGPSGATRATSASFAFSGTRGVTFECALDGVRFAACTSPKSYSSLANGTHAFQVRARDGRGQLSDASTRSWTVDTSAPPAPVIVQQPPSITNQTSARFAYTDAEAGVQWECKVDPVSYRDCTNPVNWWGLTDGIAVFTVRARDAAGNLSAPTTYTWRIDTSAPPKPRITQQPARASTLTSATFAFVDGERGVGFECLLDGAASWDPCTSPKSYTGLADGGHSFSVRAVDPAGNRSGSADYDWTVTTQAGGQGFTVRGGFVGLLAPGVSGPLTVTISNPNGEAILVTSLTVTVQPGSSKPGCDGPANLQVTPSNASVANPLIVPANGSVTLPSGGVSAPQVLMKNLPTNQDACQSATFTFTYGGSAHS